MFNINKNVMCINPASISNKNYFVHCSLILYWTQDYIKRIWKHNNKFNCLTHALGQGSQIKQHEIGTKIKQFRRWLRENEFEHHQGLNEITWNNSTIPCPHGKRHRPGENDTPVRKWEFSSLHQHPEELKDETRLYTWLLLLIIATLLEGTARKSLVCFMCSHSMRFQYFCRWFVGTGTKRPHAKSFTETKRWSLFIFKSEMQCQDKLQTLGRWVTWCLVMFHMFIPGELPSAISPHHKSCDPPLLTVMTPQFCLQDEFYTKSELLLGFFMPNIALFINYCFQHLTNWMPTAIPAARELKWDKETIWIALTMSLNQENHNLICITKLREIK